MMSEVFHGLDWVLPLRRDWLTPFFFFLTEFGNPKFFFFALPFLYWGWDKAAANRITLVLVGSVLVTFFLKDLFQDPRPPDHLRLTTRPDTFGMPSGRTLVAVAFWLTLARELGRRTVWIACGLLAIGIAFSRIYLGVHDLEDVIAGGLVGLAISGMARGDARGKPGGREKSSIAIRVVLPLATPFLLIHFWPSGSVPETVFLVGAFLPAWMLSREMERHFFDTRRRKGWRTWAGVFAGLCAGGVVLYGVQRLFASLALSGAWTASIRGVTFAIVLALVVPVILAASGLMRFGSRRSLAGEPDATS